jgi:hypothetical protein
VFVGYSFRDSFGLSMTPPVPAPGTPGGLYQYTVNRATAFTEITQTAYLATSAYTANVPIPPRSIVEVQFWQSSIDVNYYWQALLSATGSFQLSAMGMNLGPQRSLSTVSKIEDLFFYVWGKYQYPSSGQVIITVDQGVWGEFPFKRPPLQNVEIP